MTYTTLIVMRDGGSVPTDRRLIHQDLLTAFPPDIGGAAGAGLLWRRHPLTIVVQHTATGDWDNLKPRYRHLVTTTERSDHLVTAGGQAWFIVYANPTFDAVIDGKRRRTGITTEPRLTEWITRKLAAAGSDITRVKAGPVGVEKSRRPGATMTHASCRYEGRITIRDPDALRHAITTGIGRGRAYGFGLLTVVPL